MTIGMAGTGAGEHSLFNTDSQGGFAFTGGSVGIGTSSPDTLLDVYDSTATNVVVTIKRGIQGYEASLPTAFGVPYLTIGDLEYRTNSIQSIGFGYSNGSYKPAEIGFQTTNVAGVTSGDLVFATRTTTVNGIPTERMRITNSGSVGIGTTSPEAELHV
jgi:hypothetical protein